MVGPFGSGEGLTIREAATLLGVHPNTVRNRIKDGTYEAEKIVTESGPTYYLSRESLLDKDASQALPRDSQQTVPLVSREAELALQELLPSLVRELEASREAAAEREKRDSVRQGAIEYWKTSYDFFKHLTTIALAAIAGLGALLGGVFSGETWYGEDLLFGLFSFTRIQLIYWTFGGLFMAALSGMGAMFIASRHLYEVGTLETQDELKASLKGKNSLGSRLTIWTHFGFWALTTVITLGVGVAGFCIFVLRSVIGD